MKTKKLLIIGNLKQNPKTLKEAITLTRNYAQLRKVAKNIDLGIALPFVFLPAAQKEFGKGLPLYAQTVSDSKDGAHTGEVGATQLTSIGIKNVIIGHSERRARGDTNEEISGQVENALVENMNVILCVGEKERHADAGHIHFVEKQIESALFGIKKTDTTNITIAYEPVWAIGNTAIRAATENEIYEMTITIRKKLVEMFGRTAGGDIRILYGGSVNVENCESLLLVHHIEGFLVGRASLDVKEMKNIILKAKPARAGGK